ncbi:MAG TPA: toll/interleukin-1 receptor domain-containing protein [Steroidobacteraceae bacterium]|nr:toll/interleukin-1 receptor domain-containing protein [Steroidobacteraceae bacterium]
MSAENLEDPTRPRPTVFLSYASEDRSAAQRIRDALPGYGMEVWYDESDLVGGDAWDQKIRGQIRACDYFMPVISAHTEARHEGYFRREWRLAVERTLDMADDHVFLLPVVIDGTAEAGARVPDKFRAVQWLRVPDGQPTAALEAVCRRLVSGESAPRPSGERALPVREPRVRPRARDRDTTKREFPAFPREEPGQKTRFWFQVGGWMLEWTWTGFQRLPRWVRILAYVWLAIFLLTLWQRPDVRDDSGVSAQQQQKLKSIAAGYPGHWTAADTARLISQIAQQIPADEGESTSAEAPVLAIPFGAPQDDAAAQKLAASVFTQVYGRLMISRHGNVTLSGEPLPTLDPAAAVQQGRAHHSTYTLLGSIAGSAPNQQLTVKVLSVADGSTLWSKSFPATGADPAGIAAEVSEHVPRQVNDD